MKRLILLIVILIFLTGGLFARRISSSATGGTQLQYFHYGGYSDTIYSLVSGNVYTKQGDELVPLAGVAVSDHTYNADHTAGSTHGLHTDTAGQVLLAFTSGMFDIVLHKQGYTTLTLENFQSRPDQVSSFSVILSKGDGKKEIDVSEEVKKE